jgi:benzodiazapine receptor
MIPNWLIIGVITFTIAFLFNRLIPSDFQWFYRLRRPRWLTFEWAIPFIWIFIFTCGFISASLVWDRYPGTTSTWLLMGFYLLLELTILAYTPVMCKLRSLNVGTIIGIIGFILGLILTIIVFPIHQGAGWLLIPYLLWSPIGSFVTWQMKKLNPGNG